MTTRADLSEMIRLVAASLDSKCLWGNRGGPVIPDRIWTAFRAELDRISVPVSDLVPRFEVMFLRKTFNEPIQKCTDRAWIRRYDGARVTHELLRAGSTPSAMRSRRMIASCFSCSSASSTAMPCRSCRC